MERYFLEVSNIGIWKHIQDFSCIRLATAFGREFLSQNSWRVIDRTTGSKVHEYDGIGEIEAMALQESIRFENTDHWRQRFSEIRELDIQRAQEVRSRPQLRRLHQVAFQHAQRLSANRPYGEFEHIKFIEPREKINWLKEGF